MLQPLRTACVGLLLAALSVPALAQQTTPARAAMVVDLTSNAILLEKNPDEPLPPASMSKLMTLYMIFEALESGRMKMEDTFRTSTKASKMGGSKMFIADGEVVTVKDLLRGVIVQSGNDAAVALAEALSGTETAFADLMTKRAAELGLKDSSFTNSTGWPDPDHLMSVRDLARLAELMIVNYPEYYKYFAEEEMEWAGIKQRNRNPLLGLELGADGLKTGHTEAAGYGLVGSAERNGRRVVLVITGLESSSQRRQEAERLINWAFRAFDTRTLFKAKDPVASADVWLGAAPSVRVAPSKDVIVTAPYGKIEEATVAYVYDGPVEAPIEEGQQIGHVEIRIPEMPTARVPALALNTVAEGGIISRLRGAAHVLLGHALEATGLQDGIGGLIGGGGEEPAAADG